MELKEFDFNINTTGMELHERRQLIENMKGIPIGTKCYRSGDFVEYTTILEVDEKNQKEITMFWNSLYFISENEADEVTSRAHADYGNYLFGRY